MIDVTLSLVSHTNVGKTTLARTLLRRDVGEVLDQPHVTEVSEAFTAIETEDARLLLWDTPGLGDTARLVQRLRRESNALGWFLHQVWDRNLNRPLWCSQEALRNVRDDADIVLYLVNAAEDPRDAGYVEPELEILGWLGRPTLVLLNQTGPQGAGADRLVDEWRRFLEPREIVGGLLPLDAFARCWVQEDVLFDHVAGLLDGEKRAAMEALAAAWRKRNLATFRRSVELVAGDLARAATDREALAGLVATAEGKKQAMAALARRLEESQEALWDEIISAHGLEGGYASEVRRNLDAFVVSGETLVSPKKGALVGGVISGAIGGLAADILAGGLTFGGGVLAGAILGALGGAGLGHAIRLLESGDAPEVSWAPEVLDQLVERSVLRYLAVAHYGRGRGRFEEGAQPEAWSRSVQSALAARREAFSRHWKEGAEGAPGAHARLSRSLATDLRGLVESLLSQVYPRAR